MRSSGRRWIRVGAALLLAGLLVAARCERVPIAVAVFGDSHSDTDRTPRRDWLAYAFPNLEIEDHAVRGEKCWEVVPRFFDAVHTLEAEVVVFFCGTNDVGAERWDLAETVGEIVRATDRAQQAGFDVVVVAPPPVLNDGDRPFELKNQRLLALRNEILPLGERPGVVVADLWTETWSWMAEDPALLVDRLHLDLPGRSLMGFQLSLAVGEAHEGG